jgi:COP9 signalosome complex subunit 3
MQVAACVVKHEAEYLKDTNLGLVKQCVESLYKRNIQRLTQTYLTLSLEDIASSVALPAARDAELRILRMIGAGEIHATINQKDGMVRFLEDPEQYNSGAMLQRLDLEVQNMTVLARKVAAVDEAVSSSRHFLSKTMHKGERHGRFQDPEDIYGLADTTFDRLPTVERSASGLGAQ